MRAAAPVAPPTACPRAAPRRGGCVLARVALLAVALLAGGPDAGAQDQPAAPPGTTPPAAQPAPQPTAAPVVPAAGEAIPPGTVLRLLGRDVTGPKGEVMAQIINIMVDAAGQPRAAILDYGGFLGVGKRRIAVAWRVLRFAPDEKTGAITLGLSPEQLKSFPEFRPDAPLVVAAPPDPPAEPPPAAPAPAGTD